MLLDDPGEVLRRQVPPNLFSNGRLARELFKARDRDRGKVSVDRGHVDPEVARRRYVAAGSTLESCGVVGVSINELGVVKLRAFASPTMRNSDHAHIDRTAAIDPSEERRIDIALRNFAMARGWLLGPL